MFFRFTPYFFSFFFIAIWWAAAFVPSTSKNLPIATPRIPLDSHTDTHLSLSKIQRKELLAALNGDFFLIRKLLIDWEIDNQLMQRENSNIQRLSSEEFAKGILLASLLSEGSDTKVSQFRTKTPSTWKRILPHSFASAAIVLAIAPQKKILAIPEAMRKDAFLFPPCAFDTIHENLDQHFGERFFLNPADGAFVTSYSHPKMLQAFKNQGIPYLCLQTPNSLADILETIPRIGTQIDRSLEAELIVVFMKAALLAMDNRLKVTSHPSALLTIASGNALYVPGKRSLIGQLAERLDLTPPVQPVGWQEEISLEELHAIDPEILMIATEDPSYAKKHLHSLKEKSTLKATDSSQVFAINYTALNYPTQHLLIGYFELFSACMEGSF